MASISVAIQRLFDSFVPERHDNGEIYCEDCGITTRRSKLKLLKHMKKVHREKFNRLVDIQRLSNNPMQLHDNPMQLHDNQQQQNDGEIEEEVFDEQYRELTVEEVLDLAIENISDEEDDSEINNTYSIGDDTGAQATLLNDEHTHPIEDPNNERLVKVSQLVIACQQGLINYEQFVKDVKSLLDPNS